MMTWASPCSHRNINVDGIVIISDGGENCPPHFSNVYARYTEKYGAKPVYSLQIGGKGDFGISKIPGAVEYDIQGMDYQEASRVVGKPLGTVKSRLARARGRLRDCLQGYWELLPASFRLMGESEQ